MSEDTGYCLRCGNSKTSAQFYSCDHGQHEKEIDSSRVQVASECALSDDLAKVIEDCQNVMKITLSGNSIIFERIDVALQKYRKAREVKP